MAEGVSDKNTGGKSRQGKGRKKSQRVEFAPPSGDAQDVISFLGVKTGDTHGIEVTKNGDTPSTSRSSLTPEAGASGMAANSGPTEGKKKKKCRKSPKQRKKERMAKQANDVVAQPNEPPDRKSCQLPIERKLHREVEDLKSTTTDEGSVLKNESPSFYLHVVETLMDIGTLQLDIDKQEGREKVELTASRSATMIDWYGLLAGAGSGSLAGIADEDEAAASRSCSHNMAVGDASDIVEICIRCGKRM